ncbi:FecR domain-containing protein, partial [Candidatus Falkowbacteria bacterium]|nr:FecR domain-containing protein [Candidatus Falkowbacteria bacterium]
MKKILTVILLILAIILGGTWGLVASYADTVEIDDPAVKLIPLEGSTFYAVSGNDWQALIDEVEIEQGTAIKTEADSKAKVVFFDTQELVLDEQTEIIVNQAFVDENAPLYTKVKTTLEKGQIWSRLLELMNPDAAFEVESANVVATVRGTSFNMKAD